MENALGFEPIAEMDVSHLCTNLKNDEGFQKRPKSTVGFLWRTFLNMVKRLPFSLIVGAAMAALGALFSAFFPVKWDVAGLTGLTSLQLAIFLAALSLTVWTIVFGLRRPKAFFAGFGGALKLGFSTLFKGIKTPNGTLYFAFALAGALAGGFCIKPALSLMICVALFFAAVTKEQSFLVQLLHFVMGDCKKAFRKDKSAPVPNKSTLCVLGLALGFLPGVLPAFGTTGQIAFYGVLVILLGLLVLNIILRAQKPVQTGTAMAGLLVLFVIMISGIGLGIAPASVVRADNDSAYEFAMRKYRDKDDNEIEMATLVGYDKSAGVQNFVPPATCEVKVNDVTVTRTLEAIDEKVFYQNADLISVTITPNIKKIDILAFAECKNLKKVTIQSDVPYLASSAFIDCPMLDDVSFGAGMKTVTGFGKCPSLKKVVLPSGVESIDSAFYETGIENITLPGSLKKIDNAFSRCVNLTAITIPNSVTSMKMAFSGCVNLTSANLPLGLDNDDTKTRTWWAFDGCEKLTQVTIPNGLKEIPEQAVASTAISQFSVPASVKVIKDDAFSKCNNLRTVTIPGTVESVGSAFSNNPNLTEAYVEKEVKTLGATFGGCKNLQKLVVYGDTAASWTLITECDFSKLVVYGKDRSSVQSACLAYDRMGIHVNFVALDGTNNPKPPKPEKPTPNPNDDTKKNNPLETAAETLVVTALVIDPKKKAAMEKAGYTMDQNGHWWRTEFHDGKLYSYEYDMDGNLLNRFITNGNGSYNITSYTLDANGNPQSGRITYHDTNGNIVGAEHVQYQDNKVIKRTVLDTTQIIQKDGVPSYAIKSEVTFDSSGRVTGGVSYHSNGQMSSQTTVGGEMVQEMRTTVAGIQMPQNVEVRVETTNFFDDAGNKTRTTVMHYDSQGNATYVDTLDPNGKLIGTTKK